MEYVTSDLLENTSNFAENYLWKFNEPFILLILENCISLGTYDNFSVKWRINVVENW